MAWKKTDDGSIETGDGKVIYFSAKRFVSDICLGDCCFICGAKPDTKEFNNEHILPKWLLRKYDLFAREITLPNDTTVRYDRYTVPCCAECNSLMGEVVEEPLSKVLSSGANAINDFARDGDLLKLFVWMGLIYLKTHLKDRALREHRDNRKGDGKIADQYDWSHIHHIHSIVRCFYNGCTIEPGAIGSFLTMPVHKVASADKFDFADLYLAQTMLIRLENTAMFAVFNDSGGAMNYFYQKLERISGPVSELQAREIMVELAYLNLHLKERPVFQTETDLPNEKSKVIAIRPQLALSTQDRLVRGKLLHHAVRHALPHIKFEGQSDEEVLAAVTAGDLSFLFNDEGEFIKEPPKLL